MQMPIIPTTQPPQGQVAKEPYAPAPAHHAAHAGVVEGLRLGNLGAQEGP